VFARQVLQICELANQPLSAEVVGELRQTIREAIKPFDVAGLSDESRHPWYPAMASDLLRNARKVNASENEIRMMLGRCGCKPD
jgi:hypothetical protein